MAQGVNRVFCGMLRTKTAYWRTPEGERLFDPESSSACYICLLTQRPYGPDALPANAQSCGQDRGCFKPDDSR